MSGDASQPDGTDPRILQPEGRDVHFASSVAQSSGRVYHKSDCPRLDEMKHEEKVRDIAVAEWKGMKPCKECHGPRLVRGGVRAHAVEGPAVDVWRDELVRGATCADLASDADVGRDCIRLHARGEAVDQYRHPPEQPPVRHTYADGWHFVDSEAQEQAQEGRE